MGSTVNSNINSVHAKKIKTTFLVHTADTIHRYWILDIVWRNVIYWAVSTQYTPYKQNILNENANIILNNVKIEKADILVGKYEME